MDGKTYAADSKGVYVYDADNRTWQTLTTEVTAGQYDQLNAANGKLSISANSGNNTSPRYTQMTILSIDSKTTEKVDTTIFGTGGAVYLTINSTGLSYEGVPYYYYSGPIFNNNQDRMTVLCRYEGEGEDAAWIRVKESAFWSDAENPNQFATKVRPASVDVCMNPAVGVTLHGQSYGHTISSSGSLYLETASTTITFDANGGTLNGAGSVTGQIYSEIPVSVQTTAARDGYVFSGWSYDTEGKTTWTSNDTVFPAKDITLYAKWIDPSEVDDPLAYHRQSALESLKRQYEKYSKSDYSDANWAKLEQAYQDGIKAINEAPASDGKYIEDNIIAELNKALQAMGAIKPDRAGKIDIIVSLDAQTLGLGYYIDPTIVTVDKYTQASYVITDLIKQTIKEKYKMDLEGATVYHVSEPTVEPPYAYMMTGTEANSFYLAQLYWPDQTKAQVAKYIQNYADWKTDGYKDGKYLGEFDYCDKSGWMYSIADRETGNPSFPGVGAADWRLSDGEVMRWQFTVWGYGADLAADNSEWGQPSIAYKDDGTAAGDKTALTVMVAELRQVYGDKLLRNNRTYFEIHRDVLCNPLATQEELDAAVAKRSQIEEELKDAYAAENAKDLIEAIGTVTLERKAAIEAARAAYDALTEEQLAIFNELYGELAAHNYQETVDAQYLKSVATCTSPAIYYKSCSVCGATSTETFEYGEKAAHSYVQQHDAEKHWEECSVCHTKINEAAHSGGTATCIAKAVCSVCRTEYGALADHDTVHHGRIEPTCTTTGSIEYWQCSACSKKFSNEACTTEVTNVTLDKLPHSAGTAWEKDTTYHWHLCTSCGSEVMDKAVHTYGDWVTVAEATETEAGLRKRTCSVCGYEQTEEISMLRFTVTVRNGSGSGEYKSGETVTITADRRSGYTFEKWTVNSGNVTLAKETDSTTTFTMPAENVTVTATYRYNGGSGSGSGSSSGIVIKDENGKVLGKADPDTGIVELPITPVPAASSSRQAEELEITIPKNTTVKVEIPVRNVTPGTVVVIVHADGTEEIVRTSIVTKNGVALELTSSATVKVYDNSKFFTDVPAANWASDAVAFASSRELFNGTGADTFSPNAPMTRQMLMTVLARLDGTDTSGNAYAKGMEWAIRNGVSNGSDPEGKITREQLATMLWRYAGSPSVSGRMTGFADADQISGYAEDAMLWATKAGIIGGKGNGQLDPKGYATRAEVAAMLMRYCNTLFTK